MRAHGTNGRRRLAGLIAAVIGVAAIVPAGGQVMRRNPGAARGLPWQASDGHGQSWYVYQPWLVTLQGNFPVYNQAAVIAVNGTQPQLNGFAARVEEKTGELVIENMPVGQLTLTRRVLVNPDDGSCRVVDAVRNTTAGDLPLSLSLSSTVNYGVQSSQLIPDPRKPGQNLAWAAAVAAGQNKAAVDVYALPGGRVVPTIESQQGSNQVQATVTTTVPAGKEVAFVHWHVVTNGTEAGAQWVRDARPTKLLADLPAAVRRQIVNVGGAGVLPGLDAEVLRGDALDVVEVRGGDRFNGTLLAPSYKLETFYGTVELPAEKVVGVVNVGPFRPRQLVVTADGQVFGGHLQSPTADLQLSSGQKVQIPLAQVTRFGYRKRPGEADAADDTPLAAPYAVMTTGERIGVTLSPDAVPVVTRYGSLSLPPAALASIVFNGDESAVHTVTLTDGSHFTGLVTAAAFDAKLTAAVGDHGGQAVKLPVGMLNRIVFSTKADDAADPATATLQVRNNDLLVGVVQGALKLDTAFDTIALQGPEVRALARAKDNAGDAVVTTWDGTKFNGQLQEGELPLKLACGVELRVPVGLLDGYANPTPAVPGGMVDRVKQLVADLNADDWKQRDTASQQLVKLGPGVVGALKATRDAQPPEAQQRIDAIVKQLQKAEMK